MGGAGIAKGISRTATKSLRKQLYEIGQKTLTKSDYKYFSSRNADAVRRGIDIVRHQGWGRASMPSFSGLASQAWKTVFTGLTPTAAEGFPEIFAMIYGFSEAGYGFWQISDSDDSCQQTRKDYGLYTIYV